MLRIVQGVLQVVMLIMIHFRVQLLLRLRLLHLLIASRISMRLRCDECRGAILSRLASVIALSFALLSVTQLALMSLVLMLQLSLVMSLKLLLVWGQAMIILNASLHSRSQISVFRLIQHHQFKFFVRLVMICEKEEEKNRRI